MHHPEQYKAMATGIHQNRLSEGLASQEFSRSQPASDRWHKFSERFANVAQSVIFSIKSAVSKLAHINLKSKQSQTAS